MGPAAGLCPGSCGVQKPTVWSAETGQGDASRKEPEEGWSENQLKEIAVSWDGLSNGEAGRQTSKKLTQHPDGEKWCLPFWTFPKLPRLHNCSSTPTLDSDPESRWGGGSLERTSQLCAQGYREPGDKPFSNF